MEKMEIKYRRDLNKLLWHLGVEGDTAEIGCAEGFFSADILRWNLPGKHYMIDNWETIPNISGDGNNAQEWHDKNYADAMERVKEFHEKVVVLRGMSVQMARHIPDSSLALAYVDCDHTKIGVANDIQAYYPKLVTGGVIAFHDYEMAHYGVKSAVNEFAQANGLELHFIAEDKLEDAGAWFVKK